MKICQHCNNQMEDTARFCPHCGAQSPSDQQMAEQEKNCLYILRRNLRHERNVWLIFGIFHTSFVLIYFMAMLSSINDIMEAIPLILFLFLCWGVFGGISIYQTISLSRLEQTVYMDCTPAVARADKVVHIVLGGIFNEISWIFAMMNMIHVKNNKRLLDHIIEKQKSQD